MRKIRLVRLENYLITLVLTILFKKMNPDSDEITEVFVNPYKDGKPKVFFSKHDRPHYAGNNFFDNNNCKRIRNDNR